MAVQIVLSAWLIVQAATIGNQADLTEADLWVICTHRPAATADTGTPAPTPHRHGQCPACACPQLVKLLAPPPTPPVILVMRPRSQTLLGHIAVIAAEPASPSPYPARAPPFSA